MRISSLTTKVLMQLYTSGKPIMLVGKPGCAKTSVVGQFTETVNLGLVPFHLTSVDAPDMRGFLIPQKTDAGPVALFTEAPLMNLIRQTGKSRGIVFLDEFSQADHLVQKAAGPLLSERKCGESELPPGWVVWAASNRVSDKAGTNRMLGHITNRVGIIEVSADVDGWCRWANDAGVHPMYIAFARARPGIVFDADASASPERPFCTPRSFTYAHDFHALTSDGMHLTDDPVTQEIIQGYIGEAAAAELFSFCKVANELPTIEEIRAHPDKAKVPSTDRLDAQYAAMQMVVHHATATDIDPLFQYLMRLNKELQTAAGKQLIEKTGGTLLNSRVLGKWISENKALIVSTFS